MQISLIHPSRGRPQKSIETTNQWYNRFGGHDLDLIVSLDNSDPEKEKYIKLYESNGYPGDYRIVYYDNKSVVDATNNACKWSNADILIYLSDDFAAPINWGPIVLKEFDGVEGPLLVKVDDNLQPFHVPVLTIPIMNRALYERLGYFWHPEYKSMFCDQHLFEVCKKNGWLKMAPHLKFPHNHVSVGKAEDDETYRRSAANWNQGKALFEKHKKLGFPI